MIKAICFDLDGVFFTKKGMESFVESLISQGATEEAVRYAVFKSNEMNAYKRGEINEAEYVAFLNQYIGLNLKIEQFSQQLVAGYEINQDVVNLINQLRENGYKACICSNNFETRIRELTNKFNFLQYFDTAVFSYKVGILKPNKGIFETLIKQSEVLPEEIAYSDDNEEKLKGALELGINAFLFENFEHFQGELKRLGVNI
jgi:epoxide hydrolase-like predicted phosphatase